MPEYLLLEQAGGETVSTNGCIAPCGSTSHPLVCTSSLTYSVVVTLRNCLLDAFRQIIILLAPSCAPVRRNLNEPCRRGWWPCRCSAVDQACDDCKTLVFSHCGLTDNSFMHAIHGALLMCSSRNAKPYRKRCPCSCHRPCDCSSWLHSVLGSKTKALKAGNLFLEFRLCRVSAGDVLSLACSVSCWRLALWFQSLALQPNWQAIFLPWLFRPGNGHRHQGETSGDKGPGEGRKSKTSGDKQSRNPAHKATHTETKAAQEPGWSIRLVNLQWPSASMSLCFRFGYLNLLGLDPLPTISQQSCGSATSH